MRHPGRLCARSETALLTSGRRDVRPCTSRSPRKSCRCPHDPTPGQGNPLFRARVTASSRHHHRRSPARRVLTSAVPYVTQGGSAGPVGRPAGHAGVTRDSPRVGRVGTSSFRGQPCRAAGEWDVPTGNRDAQESRAEVVRASWRSGSGLWVDLSVCRGSAPGRASRPRWRVGQREHLARQAPGRSVDGAALAGELRADRGLIALRAMGPSGCLFLIYSRIRPPS